VDIKYIEPFVLATQNLFLDSFKEEPEPQNAYLLSKDEDHNWGISGIIGIAGDTRGVVVVSFPEETAKEMVGRLVGRKITDLDEDVVDSIGEVVNIIAGNAKKGLEDYRLSISLPTVITGPAHRISWPAGIPIIGIPFKTSAGRIHLSVGLEDLIKV